MNSNRKILKNTFWLASFKFTSQLFSWIVTVIIARLLVPEDYGLMSLATIITGYAEIFNELGLGAAIIQNQRINYKDLSSIFWFSMLISMLFFLFCFVAAPITSILFKEPRIISLTQSVSVIFLLSGLQIVPLNLLN